MVLHCPGRSAGKKPSFITLYYSAFLGLRPGLVLSLHGRDEQASDMAGNTLLYNKNQENPNMQAKLFSGSSLSP